MEATGLHERQQKHFHEVFFKKNEMDGLKNITAAEPSFQIDDNTLEHSVLFR